MRISDRYIGRQVLLGTLSAITVLSVLLVLGNVFREIRPLLVEKRAPIRLLFFFMLNVLPFSLMYTIPWGFLCATLLVTSRMSTDHELIGFRIAGFSLVRLAAPVFVIAIFCSGICFWLNSSIAPKSKATVSDLLFEEAKRDPRSLLDPGVVQGRFPNQKIFVERKQSDELYGLNLYKVPNPDSVDIAPTAFVHAGKFEVVVDRPNQRLSAKLTDAFIETTKADGSVAPAFSNQAEPWIFDYSLSHPRKADAGIMTNQQITDYLRTDAAHPTPVSGRDHDTLIRRFRTELMRRVSFSFSCIAFAFIAVPLGITSRRKDTSSGLIISLIAGTAYFLISELSGQARTDAATAAILWAPNVGCVLFGMIMFRRARFK